MTDDQLTGRQTRHAHPVGLSLQQNSLPKQASKPDPVVEISGMTAAEIADFVCDWLEREYSG